MIGVRPRDRGRAPASRWLLPLLSVFACAAVGQQQVRPPQHHARFRAMDLPAAQTPAPDIKPRSLEAVPAMKHENPLEKRLLTCPAGSHLCTDLGSEYENQCCGDDFYCIINQTNTATAGCCGIGLTCTDVCSFTKYASYSTSVISTGTNSASPSTTTITACHPRSCTATSQFFCPYSTVTLTNNATSVTGGCCPYGHTCGAPGVCVSTVTPTTSSSGLPMVPVGCTTSQITCSIGGGCCANTQSCSVSGTAVFCVDTTPTPTGNISAIDNGSSSELSSGAKAGIGVGVVIGAGLVIGAITWWCIRERKSRSQAGGGSSSGRRGGNSLVGRIIGDGGGGSNVGGSQGAGTRVVGSPGPNGAATTSAPMSTPRRERDMTEASSDRGGMTRDYFGPVAAVGPYTDLGHGDGYAGGAAHGGHRLGGVPLEPQGPQDIAAPVEIYTHTKEPGVVVAEDGGVVGANALGVVDHQQQGQPEMRTVVHHAPGQMFELYGSDPVEAVSPDPLSSPGEELMSSPTPLEEPLPMPSPPDEGTLRTEGEGHGGHMNT